MVPEHNNTNLAYDLSHFDVSERERREVSSRENQRSAAQIKMAAHSVSKSGSKLKVLACTVAVFAALFATNYYSTRKDDMARMVSNQQELYDEAVDNNALLQSKLDSKVNINYIEEYAADELGMQKVTSAQKKYISVNTESLIEVEEDGSGGFFGSIKKWFGDVLEYIGF
jgi:hypothetical protein